MFGSVIHTVNTTVSSRFHLECSLYSYAGTTLIIALSEDLICFHEYELHFTNVFAVSCNADWHIDTSQPFIRIADGEEAREMNERYRVEIGNTIFRLSSEDDLPLYLIAGGVEFKEHTVKYYE